MSKEFHQEPETDNAGDFRNTIPAQAAEVARALGYKSTLDCLNNGKTAHIALISSIAAAGASAAHYCLDQIRRRGLSLAAAIDETGEVLHLDAPIVRRILCDDVRIGHFERGDLFLHQVIPLAAGQFGFCREILPPVNHPTLDLQYISESTGEGRYFYFWRAPELPNEPRPTRYYGCETTPEKIAEIFRECRQRECFHSTCENKATDKIETAQGVLDLCGDCATRYANAEGFMKLYARARAAQTDEAFEKLNDFAGDIN